MAITSCIFPTRSSRPICVSCFSSTFARQQHAAKPLSRAGSQPRGTGCSCPRQQLRRRSEPPKPAHNRPARAHREGRARRTGVREARARPHGRARIAKWFGGRSDAGVDTVKPKQLAAAIRPDMPLRIEGCGRRRDFSRSKIGWSSISRVQWVQNDVGVPRRHGGSAHDRLSLWTKATEPGCSAIPSPPFGSTA